MAAADPRSASEPGLQGSRVERRLDAKLLAKGWWFDYDEADRATLFFEHRLVAVDGEWRGHPIVLADWQRRFLRRLYGWRRADGTRRYRKAHVWIPKKNGKSFLVAGCCLYGLVYDNEPSAKIFCVANEKEQAGEVFGVAQQMVEMSPYLQGELEVLGSSIYYDRLGSTILLKSAKADSKHGANLHMVAYDEIHAARSRALYEVLTIGSGAARRQPLQLIISTAGENIAGIGYELWEMGKNLVAGITENPEHLVLIFAADPEDDPFDPKTWAKANPTYPISPKHDALQSAFDAAKLLPSDMPRTLQMHLNIWTQAKSAAIKLPTWKRCIRKELRPAGSLLIPECLEGRRCWGGLDLSSVNDLTSFALTFPWDDDQGVDVMEWYWIPEDNVQELALEHHADYPRWIAEGWLFATPGNVVDYTAVEEFVVRVGEVVNIQDIGYDPRNAQDLVQRMQDNRGFTMVELQQGYRNLSPATKQLERLYLSRQLRHRGNPVTTWQASHMVFKRNPSGDVMPDKQKSRHKIDGFAAIVNSLHRVSMGQKDASVFEKRGVIVI